MTTRQPDPMPWELQDLEVTEREVKQQFARMLATGALQTAANKLRGGEYLADRPDEDAVG